MSLGESLTIRTLGIVECLSLSRSNIWIGVASLLVESGPVCAQNVSTLRGTLKELIMSLPCTNRSSVTKLLEEKSIARLFRLFLNGDT